MATQVQFRGGTTAQNNAFTGASKELTVDTDKDVVVVHDGATAGGHPLMAEDGSNSALALGSAGTPALKFTDTNTGIYSPGADQIALSTGGAGRLFIDSSGRLLVGKSTSESILGSHAGAQFATIAGTSSFVRNTADTGSPELVSAKSRGTSGTPTIVQNDDGLWLGRFAGYDGSSYVEAARISSIVNGTPGINDMPGALIFSTTADGASTPTEHVRITSAGTVGIGASSPNERLTVIGPATSASNLTNPVLFGNIGTHTNSGHKQGEGVAIGFQLKRGSDGAATNTAFIKAEAEADLGSSWPTALTFGTQRFGSNPVELMRITSTGQMRLAGAGITFNGDTATANELDDYEEGTWTPSVEFGGATTGITYNARQGYYVKTGKVVHVWLYFNLSNKGSATGTATVAGLPFTSEDFNVSGLTTWPGSKPNRRQNETSSDFAMAVLENNSEVSISNGAGSLVTNSTFTNGTIIECALCYRAA